MGNRLCKNKKGTDVVDNSNVNGLGTKSPSKFDRIINRLHLKPTTWKSESHLNKKDNNRSKSEEPGKSESIFYTKPLSKSSDWTVVELEVPPNEDEHIHLRNPKLNFIFDNDKGTPTPPPRKQNKSSNFKEKIEKFATRSLQALQGDKNKINHAENLVPVEEPLVVKKKINYDCPLCDADEKNHNRNHHHHHDHSTKPVSVSKNDSFKKSKNKRQKNLSVVSLPNYTDLTLSIANPEGIDTKSPSKTELNSSRLSLQNPGAKKLTSSQSTGKLDSYITRCRSFGSILPQQLKKLRLQKTKTEDITSDDSFGPLEDWDVGLIEHYDPKDASLPRPRKSVQMRQKEVLEGIEGLIVTEDEIEAQKPQRPVRRSESLVKKINDEASKQQAQIASKSPEDICLTPPPSPVQNGFLVGTGKKVAQLSRQFEDPVIKKVDGGSDKPVIVARRTKTENVKDNAKRESVQEHSSLMRILQEFSVKDTQEKAMVQENNDNDNMSSLTPSLVEFERTLNNTLVEDFINAEKKHSSKALCT